VARAVLLILLLVLLFLLFLVFFLLFFVFFGVIVTSLFLGLPFGHLRERDCWLWVHPRHIKVVQDLDFYVS
jgi:hypothetical protein